MCRFARRVTIIATTVLALAPYGSRAQEFSPPINISGETGNATAPRIAVDSGGNVDAVWLDDSTGSPAVFFSRSTDKGQTFSAPLNISNHTGSPAESERIAVDPAGNIYVVWSEASSGAYTIFFSRSTDNGASFSAPQSVSQNAMGTDPAIAIDSAGGVNLLWVDKSEGQRTVFFSSDKKPASESSVDDISSSSPGPRGITTSALTPFTRQPGVAVNETAGEPGPSESHGVTTTLSASSSRPLANLATSDSTHRNGNMNIVGNLTATSGQNALATYSLNTTIYIDCIRFSCSPDIGVGINAAIGTLPRQRVPGANSIYAIGKIVLPAGTYTQATGVNINSPFVSIEGSGSSSTILNCTFDGDCWSFRTRPFTISPGGRLSGFAIVGSGPSKINAVGIHTGDLVGAHFEDLQIDNFTGSNSACFWADNQSGWFERNYIENVELGIHGAEQIGCTKLLRFTGTPVAGNSSFGYDHWSGLRMSIGPNEIGFSIEGLSYLFKDYIEGSANVSQGSTTFALPSGSSNGDGSFLLWREECGNCAPGATATGWRIAQGGAFSYEGPGLLGDPNIISILSPGPEPAFAIPLKRSLSSQGLTGSDFSGQRLFYSPSAPGINESISLDNTSGSAGIGVVTGHNVEHPIAWGYDQDPDCFDVYRKAFETPLVSVNKIFSIPCTGSNLYLNGETLAAPGKSGILAVSGATLAANSPAVCTDDSSLLTTTGCPQFHANTAMLTGHSCTTAAHAFASCTSMVPFSRLEPDTNYVVSCTGIGRTGWPYIVGIAAKSTESVSVQIGNGSGPAALPSSFNEIDCTVTR